MKSTLFKLSEFTGRNAQIDSLELPAAESMRLNTLGLFEGQSILVQRTGSAVIILAAGGRIAVSYEIAMQIKVRCVDAAAA